MGLLDGLASIATTLTEAPQHIRSGASDLIHRSAERIQQKATQVRDHFTRGENHLFDNIVRNTGNDVIAIGRNAGGAIGSAVGTGVGAMFAGVGSIPGRHLGEAAGRALGREVASNIVDGGTGIIQDFASITPGLAHREGGRHIPNHGTLLERGLSAFATRAIRPFEITFQAAGIYTPPHRLTPAEAQALHDNSFAIDLSNPEATAAHNARLSQRRTQQTS